MIHNIEDTLLQVRIKKPLILNLTNYVTMDLMANALLAIGAAPIMSMSCQELEELVNLADAVNINIGTIDESLIDMYLLAAQLAKQYKKPLILDPVGSGSTQLRTQIIEKLYPYVSIIKGNASEICSLAAMKNTKGVESTSSMAEARTIAVQLAKTYQCTIVVSSAIDFITDGYRCINVPYGSPMMTAITGMGCAVAAIIAAFHAIQKDAWLASNLAVHYFNLCGQITALEAQGPGTFRTLFLDNLYIADFSSIKKHYVK